MRRAGSVAPMLAVAVVLGILGAGPRRDARAQPADTERAIDAGRAAARLYEEGKWAEAYARFEEADRAAHSVVFVLYMARCQRALGDRAAAQALLERIATETLPADAPEPMRRAQADAASELAALREETKRAEEQPRPPAGSATAAPSVTAPPAALAPQDGPLWPGVVVLGAGVLGLGIGGVTGAMAMSETSSIEEGCDGVHCLKSDADRGDRASTLAAVSTVSFLAGGVLAATGVVLLAVRPGGGARTGQRGGLQFAVAPGMAMARGDF